MIKTFLSQLKNSAAYGVFVSSQFLIKILKATAMPNLSTVAHLVASFLDWF